MLLFKTTSALVSVVLCAAHFAPTPSDNITVSCDGCKAKAYAKIFVPAVPRRVFKKTETAGGCSCTRDLSGMLIKACHQTKRCDMCISHTEPGVPGQKNCIKFNTKWPPTKPPDCNPPGAPITATLTARNCDGKHRYWAFWRNGQKLLEIHGGCDTCNVTCPHAAVEREVIMQPK